MPTIAGLRRRGYTPESIRDFCERIGVAKKENVIDVALLEHCVREDLNRTRAARDGGAPSAQGRHRRTTRRAESKSSTSSTIRRTRRPGRARCRSRASCSSSATTSWRIRRRSSSGSRPAAKCGCAAPTSSPAREVVKDARGRDRRAALHLRSGDARRRRAGRPQGEGDAALGVGGARARRRSAALRSAVQQSRSRKRRGDFLADLNPASLDVHRARAARAERRRRSAGRAVPVRAARLLLRRSRLDAGPPRLQPHRHAQGRLGTDRAAGVADISCQRAGSFRLKAEAITTPSPEWRSQSLFPVPSSRLGS